MTAITNEKYVEYIRFLWTQLLISIATIVCLALASFFFGLMYLLPNDFEVVTDRLAIGWAFIVNLYLFAIFGMVCYYQLSKEEHKHQTTIKSITHNID